MELLIHETTKSRRYDRLCYTTTHQFRSEYQGNVVDKYKCTPDWEHLPHRCLHSNMAERSISFLQYRHREHEHKVIWLYEHT